jgi:hypothetical protein
LPKSRSIEIASSKSGLPIVTGRGGAGEVEISILDYDRPSWPRAVAMARYDYLEAIRSVAIGKK